MFQINLLTLQTHVIGPKTSTNIVPTNDVGSLGYIETTYCLLLNSDLKVILP